MVRTKALFIYTFCWVSQLYVNYGDFIFITWKKGFSLKEVSLTIYLIIFIMVETGKNKHF